MKKADLIFFGLVSITGVAVLTAAPIFTGARLEYPGFLPWLRPGIESFSKLSAAGLLVIGSIAGYLRPGRPFVWGLATMALYPIWAITEMILDPTSHNLWPLEFMMYFIYSLIPTVGAAIAAKLHR